LCKFSCQGDSYVVGNSCVPCTGTIETRYIDVDIYGVSTYVPEKCVTENELNIRYAATATAIALQAELTAVEGKLARQAADLTGAEGITLTLQADLDAAMETLDDHNKLKTRYNELVCRL